MPFDEDGNLITSGTLFPETLPENPNPVLARFFDYYRTERGSHPRYYSEDVHTTAPDTTELVIVPDADHVDLYDRKDLIPFGRLDEFFTKNLG